MFPDHKKTTSLKFLEGRVTKKLSQEFSRTENRILGTLARLDDFLMNPLIQGQSGTAPEMSRNAFSTNQGTNEDDSQSDPYPEGGIFGNQITQNSGPEDEHYKVTGATERHYMVTGVQNERPCEHYMMTGVQRERERERERESLRTLHGDRSYRTPRHGDRSSRRSHILLP